VITVENHLDLKKKGG